MEFFVGQSEGTLAFSDVTSSKKVNYFHFLRSFIPCPLHSVLEIDATEQHFEGFGLDRDFFGIVGKPFGTAKSSAFEAFCQNPKARTIPVKQLDAIALAIEKDKDLAGEWILTQLVANDHAK